MNTIKKRALTSIAVCFMASMQAVLLWMLP